MAGRKGRRSGKQHIQAVQDTVCYSCEKNGHIIVGYANDAVNNVSVQANDFLNERQAKLVGTTQKSLSCALSLKAMEAGPVMLYCSMKDGNRGCISHAVEILGLLGRQGFRNRPRLSAMRTGCQKSVNTVLISLATATVLSVA